MKQADFSGIFTLSTSACCDFTWQFTIRIKEVASLIDCLFIINYVLNPSGHDAITVILWLAASSALSCLHIGIFHSYNHTVGINQN